MMGLGKDGFPFKHGNVWYQFVRFLGCTLPKTNSFALENRQGPKGDDRLPTIHFRVRTVSFREGISKIVFHWQLHAFNDEANVEDSLFISCHLTWWGR